MPLNLIRVYNALLDIDFLSKPARDISLRGVFDRDFRHNSSLQLTGQPVYPVPGDPDALEQLFFHLTTHEVPPKSRHREYEPERSRRLHWVRPHIEHTVPANLIVFSNEEKGELRTFVVNKAERYLVVLKPLRKGGYYLLTAYPLGADSFRKVMNSYERTQRAERRRRP